MFLGGWREGSIYKRGFLFDLSSGGFFVGFEGEFRLFQSSDLLV